jgi:PKD repeat protein
MKSISTYIKHVVIVLLSGLVFLGNPGTATAQGCNQVDIKYQEPDCFKSKNSAGVPVQDHDCTPVTTCVNQNNTYAASSGPWVTYLWTITSGPATPPINPNNASATVNITWPVVGTYVLTLTVTDGSGNTFTKCLTITVKERPVAGFNFANNNACAPSPVSFTNTTTYSGTAYYNWDFGDPASGGANFSQLSDPSHNYLSPGTYTVTLIAYSAALVPSSNSGGHGDSLSFVTCCADTIKKTVTVLPGNVTIQCISTVCANTTSKYTAVGCVSPTWLPPAGGTIVATSGNTVTVQWGNGTVQGQLAVICGTCTTYAAIPIVPSSPVITGSTSPCNNGVSTYTVPYLPGTFYTWTLQDITNAQNATGLISTFPDNNSAVINWGAAMPNATYVLTVTLNNPHLCCSSTATLTITPRPSFSILGPSKICQGQTGTFNPNPFGATFNWSTLPTVGVSPPSASGTSYTATFANTGNYVVTATNTSGAFCNTTASTPTTVVPVPTPGIIQGPIVACAGGQYGYNMSPGAPNGYYYEWTVTNGTFQPGGGTTVSGDSVTVLWNSLSGTLTVQLKQSGSPQCVIPAGSITVTQATPGVVSGPTSVCVDGTAQYTVSGVPSGTTVTWSISPNAALGTVVAGQGTTLVTILWHGQGGSGPWGPVTVNASTGCGPATGLSGVMIYPKFTLNITASGTDYCLSAISLTANGAPVSPTPTYSWQPGNQTTQTISGVNSAGTYIVTATSGGCSATAQYTVQDPFAIIPVTCGVGFCNGLATNEVLGVSVIKPVSGTFTYVWRSGTCASPGGTQQTTTTGLTTNSFTAPNDGTFNALVSYGSCQKCVDFVVKKVCCPDVYNPQITQNTQVNCNTYTFTGTATPNGDTVIWNFGDGTTAPGVSGQPITHSYAQGGIYCVTFCVGPPNPNPTGCTGNCKSTIAIVPIEPSFIYTLGCCLNITNTTSVFDNTGTVTYNWNFGDGNFFTGQNPPQHCYALGGTYTITLTVTFTKPGITCTKTFSQTITYIPLSIAVTNPCTGDPTVFTSNPGGFVTYTWSFGDTYTGYTSPIAHAYASAGSYPVNLTVTDLVGNSCSASTTVNVLTGINGCTIQPGFICPGGSATLTGPSGPFTYQWEVEVSTNVYAMAPGVSNASTYTTNVPGRYRVVVMNGNGCTCTSNTVDVKSVAKTPAMFSISPSKSLCSPGDIITLSAPVITGVGYNWYINNVLGTPVSSGPFYVTFNSTTTTYTLIDSNQYGCRDTCTQIVTVSPLPPPPIITSTGLCAGVPIGLTVTNYSSNITWNTGANTPSIVVYNPGTYVATVTNPITGCSSSSSITINRRPTAGLFPHLCDSIPCKCTRPFVIYAPNPLVGAFSSTWTVDWYNANTNAYLFTGNPYNNGGIGVQTGSYYVVITDQTTGCKDTSNRYSVVVPLCDTCDCKKSSFGEMVLTMTGGNPQFPKCGKSYTLECNKTYTFATSFTCKDTACKGKVTYLLQPPTGAPVAGLAPVTFTTSQSGTYVLTLYGWCGSRICDSCVIRFNVSCPCDCKNSQWGNVVLTQSDGVDDAGGPVFSSPQPLKCGKTYKLDCNKPYSIAANFICADTSCKAKVTYTLTPPSGAPITGNAPFTFTPVLNGTYTLVLYGWCAGKICDSCIIKFDVKCGCDCDGSSWGDIVLAQSTGGLTDGIVAGTTQVLKCGKNYKLDCKSIYTLNTSFFCKDTNCKGKVTYTLIPPSGPTVNGTVPLTFTANLTGTYILKLYGWCGDKICDSCIIRFTVDCDCDCKGSKWVEKTLSNGSSTTTLNCKQQYDWSCNLPFTINGSYSCAKASCNSAATYQVKPPSGAPVTGNLPLTYTPTQTGTYNVVIYGYCGGVICDSCVVSFVVNCPKDTICCKYDIGVRPGTVTTSVSTSGNATVASQSFTFTGLTGVPLSEVRAEVLSYDLSGAFANECLACKTLPFLWASINSAGNIGAVPALISLYGGATTSVFNPTGTAVYQNPREVVWNNGTTFNLTGPVTIKFFLPPPPVIDCCELRARICVKFTFRDIYCNECDVVSCFDVIIKK